MHILPPSHCIPLHDSLSQAPSQRWRTRETGFASANCARRLVRVTQSRITSPTTTTASSSSPCPALQPTSADQTCL